MEFPTHTVLLIVFVIIVSALITFFIIFINKQIEKAKKRGYYKLPRSIPPVYVGPLSFEIREDILEEIAKRTLK